MPAQPRASTPLWLTLLAPLLLAPGCPSTTGDDDDDDDSSAECEPVPADQLDQLALGLLPGIALQPGQNRQMVVGTVACCYSLEPANACVEWSVSDESQGGISADGVLTISPQATPGASFEVIASVDLGRAELRETVTIWTPETHPLVGVWTEAAHIDCETGAESEPPTPIGEVWFAADGTLRVTWTPFELYFDYAGPYTFDLSTGALGFEAEWGNYIPSDLDTSGQFRLEGDDLWLEDLWLGQPIDGGPTRCGHRLTR